LKADYFHCLSEKLEAAKKIQYFTYVESRIRTLDDGITDIILGLVIKASAIISPLAIWNLSIFAALGKRTAAFLAIITGVILLFV
jgi:hypothetical protein